MGRIVLRLSEALYNAAWAHLRPEASTLEEAGVLYGTADHVGEGIEFTAFEWRGIQPHEFATRNEYFIELDDDVRAGVIKRAHNLNACLIEFHTHPMPGGACFSPSDIKGLKELAPQLLWRLKKRPYVAVVVAPDGLDALAWTSEGVRQVDGILVDARPLLPASRRTLTTRYAP